MEVVTYNLKKKIFKFLSNMYIHKIIAHIYSYEIQKNTNYILMYIYAYKQISGI